jgi:HEAT repeat protein
MPQTKTPAPRPIGKAKKEKPVPPPEFEEKGIATMDAASLISILKDSGSSEFQKAKACMRIGELGAAEAVPVLAAMLDDEHLSVYARYGLEPIPDPAVDDALRAAMSELKGDRLIGVINSIAKRRDAEASAALTKLVYDSDAGLAQAAIAALGNIGAASSRRVLTVALGKTSGLTRMIVADASLVCAERLLAQGERDMAMGLYTTLSAPDIPKAARLAAMSAIIREERSISRPR